MKKILLLVAIFTSLGSFAQTIQSVNPNSGSSGQNLTVTITGNGTNFTQISTSQNVTFFNSLAQSLVVNAIDAISPTILEADITIPYYMPTGAFNLTIYSSAGTYFLANAFNVTNTANVISGNVAVDINGNGCDAADVSMGGIKVVLNDGTSDSFTYTDADGNYTFYVPAGTYTVTPMPEMPYFSSSPPTGTINFATQSNLTATQDFCIGPNGSHTDLTISILDIEPARPGFDAVYRLVYRNNGTQTMSGTVSMAFDEGRLDFVSSTAVPSSQALGNLTWNYSDLLPLESRELDVTLNVNSPMEAPPVNIGDVLVINAIINPIDIDETPVNNFMNLNQTVVGSYDPNDKAVAEGGSISIDDVGNYLHYMVRFQNTGTFAAENVVIKDMLASNLDASTLEVISASHPYRTSLSGGNKLEFFFEDINLPASIEDEPGSHGYVAFRIRPSDNVVVGSTISNTAEIYFDFNFPIITNTVQTTVTTLATNSFDIDRSIVMFPNPAGDILNLSFTSNLSNASVKIYNQLGQLVKSVDDIDETGINPVFVGDLKSGTYLVRIGSESGSTTKTLIKL